MTVDQYIDSINARYKLGNATEHTFRGDLQQLIESLVPEIRATNEPKRQSCGAPDYILTKNDIPVGFIEAKDIGDKDLDGIKKTGNKEQFDRYKSSLNNLIFTDYIDFHLYREGEFITRISIGEIAEKGIKPIASNFSAFENLIKDFSIHIGQTIKSSKKLAEMMASKARLLSDIIGKSLTSDENNNENSTLKEQMEAFKEILIHDITPEGFADLYAQTIAYGMFAARLHDSSLPTFSRQEAAELIPKTNPFLRKLFGYIAGPDIDDRIKWIVDSLVEIFLACNVQELLRNYGNSTRTEDPIIHFYETFLCEYDPKLRKARGVWYTPQPVVKFIVRAVDDILKSDFGLIQGLADTSKTKIKIKVANKKTANMRSRLKEELLDFEVHKVQILDPATGTGTFLSEVIKHIYHKFIGQQGIWSNYVENHLLSRLNGFELLMASYAMAHLQLNLLLTDTGYIPKQEQRLRVYLTNSLEEHHPDTGTLFANWLSTEANEANRIKRDTPVMCILGNPPYSISSTNKGDWIQNLILDYKQGLNERKVNLDDDYIKFIRFGQYFIDKNGSGILAYISNNSFIDGTNHRQMRKQLLESFDKIYILNLHGNSKKKECSPDGTIDQNVFDIMQGVSINIFIKGSEFQKSLGEVFYKDLFGKREGKYRFLEKNSLLNIKWEKVSLTSPNYFFINKDLNLSNKYKLGFSLCELFLEYNSGVQTKNDKLTVKRLLPQIEEVVSSFKKESIETLKSRFDLKDSAGWKIANAISDIKGNLGQYVSIYYRLFDTRFTYFTGKSSGFLGRPRGKAMNSMTHRSNIGLIFKRTGKVYGDSYDFFFVSNTIISEGVFAIDPLGREYIAPLYLYNGRNGQQDAFGEKVVNLNVSILDSISKIIGLEYSPENLDGHNVFSPEDIFNYVYAVAYSPSYRKKYEELLKIDFPRIPYPKDPNEFWKLVKLGNEIRQIHLLESSVFDNYITQYPVDGDNLVTKPVFKSGRVYINDSQYFDSVPLIAWEFYIGGCQPVQKWLKDRRGQRLRFDDIHHFQKIIIALAETNRIMKEIDKIKIVD